MPFGTEPILHAIVPSLGDVQVSAQNFLVIKKKKTDSI